MSSPLPPKKDVALALLERSSVFVYLDPRRDGVVTPAGFKKDPKLVLQVGLNMAVPIHDLKFDDLGLSCTLSFNRTPFFCVVPWGAIFALTDDAGQGIVWPDDVPRELMEAQAQAQRRAALRVVPNDEPAPAPAPHPAAESPQEAAGDKSAKTPKKPSKKAKETVSTDEVRPTRVVRGKTKPAAAEAAKKTGEKAEKPSKAAAKKADAKAPKKAAKKVAAEAPEKATNKAAKQKPKKASSETKGEAAPPKPAAVQPGLFDSPPPKAVPPPLPASATSPAPPAPPAASPSPSPPSPSPMRIGKTRRELPPYLRVVK